MSNEFKKFIGNFTIFILILICLGISIAYIIIINNENVNPQVKQALSITWSVLISINTAIIPLRIFSLIFLQIKKWKKLKNKDQQVNDDINFSIKEKAIIDILNSNMPDPIKRLEILKIIATIKEDQDDH